MSDLHQPTGRELIEMADRHLDDTLDRLDKGLSPIWEGQIEIGKTVLTLSAGALVLSMSLIQILADIKDLEPHWKVLLPIAWVFLAASVATGVSRQGWSSAARSLRIHVEQQRGEIRRMIWDLEAGPEYAEKFDQILKGAMEKAQDEALKGIRVFEVLTQVSAWSFFLGLLCLLLFAIKNMPF